MIKMTLRIVSHNPFCNPYATVLSSSKTPDGWYHVTYVEVTRANYKTLRDHSLANDGSASINVAPKWMLKVIKSAEETPPITTGDCLSQTLNSLIQAERAVDDAQVEENSSNTGEHSAVGRLLE